MVNGHASGSPLSPLERAFVFVFGVVKDFCEKGHHTLSQPLNVPRPLELLLDLRVIEEKGGVRGYQPLPLFSAAAGLYPGFTVWVVAEGNQGVVNFTPTPLVPGSEHDVGYNLVHVIRAPVGHPNTMARMGLERLMRHALVTSHDLIEGREPQPIEEPTLPALTGGQATMELLHNRESGMTRRVRIERELAAKKAERKKRAS